jgi:membrane protein
LLKREANWQHWQAAGWSKKPGELLVKRRNNVNIINFLKQVFGQIGKDKVGVLSAAFAYTAIFAIAPLLLIIVSIVGFIFGERAASGELYSHLSSIVGPDSAKTIQGAIAHTHTSGAGAVAFIVGIIGSLLAAAGLASQMQNAFDTILGAVPDPKAGIKKTIYAKLKNVLLIVAAGLFIVASVILSAVVSGLGHKAKQQLGLPAPTLEAINSIASLIIFVSILYLIYKVLPNVFIPRKVVLAASAIVSLLFLIGKIILGFMIGRNSTASAYGAAASLIVLLLWFYYAAQILLLGAEGMKVYGQRHNLVYKAKKYTLKREIINLDLKNDLAGTMTEKFIQGFRNKSKK